MGIGSLQAVIRRILSPIITMVSLTIVAATTIVLGTILMAVVRIRPESRIPEALARTWASIFLFVTLTRPSIEGLERIDTSASYVVVSNHISNLDPPLHIAMLPLPIRFLAKKELFKVPVLGPAMRAYGIIETDRQAHGAAHRRINTQVAAQISRGKSLIIYPEGTRSADGTFRAFKKGAFRIAIDNGMPILPVAIAGTHAAWVPGKKLIRGGRARAIVGEPIPVDGLETSDITDLRDRSHAAVEALLSEL